MTRHIASTSRIAVLEPGPSDVSVLLVDNMVKVLQLQTKGSYHVYPARAGTNADDAEALGRAEGLFADRVISIVVVAGGSRRISRQMARDLI